MGKIDVDINFNNRSGREIVKGVSFVISQKSLFYGLWNKGDELIKAEYQVRSSSLMQQIKSITEAFEEAEIKLSSLTLPFLHIPLELFSEKNANTFFEEIYPKRLLEDRIYKNDEIEEQQIVVSYYLPKGIGKRLGKRTTHFSTLLGKIFNTDNQLIGFVDDTEYVLCYIKEGKLHFYNQYSCHHPEDFLYYSLLAYEEFDLDAKSFPLHLSGRVTMSSQLTKLLQDYLSIEFIEFDKKHFRVEQYPQHFYHDLFLSWICA